MENQRKNVAIIIIVVGIVLISMVSIITISNSNRKRKNETNINLNANTPNVEMAYEENKQEIDIKGTENVEVSNDLTTENTSSRVKENKSVAGLNISETTVKYTGSSTKINGKITNNGSSDIDADFVNANIMDSQNNTFRKIKVYIGKVKAGASKELDIETQADLSNMYDMEFTK